MEVCYGKRCLHRREALKNCAQKLMPFPVLPLLSRKNPWRLSSPRKQRVRERLRNVDDVIETIQQSGIQCSALERALQLPKEDEMPPKDKYTTFSRTARDFRKSVHKVSSWGEWFQVEERAKTKRYADESCVHAGAKMDKADASNESKRVLIGKITPSVPLYNTSSCNDSRFFSHDVLFAPHRDGGEDRVVYRDSRLSSQSHHEALCTPGMSPARALSRN